MSAFVNQTQEVNRVTLHLVADVVRERFRSAAGKAIQADVVAAAPANDLSCLPRDTFMESTGKALGNFVILGPLAGQVFAKPAAENRLHCGLPKTSANVRPESLPESKSLSR